jgi:hypothetical protein
MPSPSNIFSCALLVFRRHVSFKATEARQDDQFQFYSGRLNHVGTTVLFLG